MSVLEGKIVLILPGTPASQLTPLPSIGAGTNRVTQKSGVPARKDQHPFHWFPIYLRSRSADFQCPSGQARGELERKEGRSTSRRQVAPGTQLIQPVWKGKAD